MSIDAVKIRIRKLLNLAENDAAADGEIDNALRFARKLMLEHNIEEGDVRSVEEVAMDEEYGKSGASTLTSKLSQWEKTLSTAITELVGTVKHYSENYPSPRRTSLGIADGAKHAKKIVFYGPLTDAADAAALFYEWSETILAMAKLRYNGAFRGDGREYCEGFAQELWSKVRKIIAEDRQLVGPDCTALVVSRAKDVMLAKRGKAEDWLSSTGMSLGAARRSSGRSHYNPNARSEGRADGGRADFQRNERTKQITGGGK